MTDIAFLLLLFFLVFAISSEILPVPLDPADSSSNKIAEESEIQLLVDAAGNLYLNDSAISIEEIPVGKTVSLMADKDTPFAAIFPVIEYLRSNGTKTLRCLVETRI